MRIERIPLVLAAWLAVACAGPGSENPPEKAETPAPVTKARKRAFETPGSWHTMSAYFPRDLGANTTEGAAFAVLKQSDGTVLRAVGRSLGRTDLGASSEIVLPSAAAKTDSVVVLPDLDGDGAHDLGVFDQGLEILSGATGKRLRTLSGVGAVLGWIRVPTGRTGRALLCEASGSGEPRFTAFDLATGEQVATSFAASEPFVSSIGDLDADGFDEFVGFGPRRNIVIRSGMGDTLLEFDGADLLSDANRLKMRVGTHDLDADGMRDPVVVSFYSDEGLMDSISVISGRTGAVLQRRVMFDIEDHRAFSYPTEPLLTLRDLDGDGVGEIGLGVSFWQEPFDQNDPRLLVLSGASLETLLQMRPRNGLYLGPRLVVLDGEPRGEPTSIVGLTFGNTYVGWLEDPLDWTYLPVQRVVLDLASGAMETTAIP